LDQQTYHKLISGQNPGLVPELLRFLLGIAAEAYSLVVRLRNSLYSKGWLKTHHVDAAVLCIGNITVGGTGKTPLVVWLFKLLQQKNIRCAVLTRGYKTHTQKQTSKIDEPAILAESCPEAKVVVNPDRVKGAAQAIGKFGAKVLIMDDGFQHRRLARDLDIVTIDATLPFGYGKIFPAGLLREPVASLKRADAVVITRCDQIAKAQLGELEEKLRAINPDMAIARSIHDVVYAKSTDNKEISIEKLSGKKIFAFCGIGNPDAFLNTIKALGAELVGSKVYDDHFYYKDGCLADIYGQAEQLKADLILTTQKDWTKIARLAPAPKDIQLAHLAIEIKFLAGEDKLTALIEEVLTGKISQK
jgi:tetraacyldisaccharide 4'-kinase